MSTPTSVSISPGSLWRKGVGLLLALLWLNGLLSFTGIWPTLLVVPDTRIAPEFIVLLLLLSAVVAIAGPAPRRLLGAMAGVYLLLVVGRYADVVVPHLLGRPVNLYWDMPQIPRFLWVTAGGLPWWVTVIALLLVCALVWLFHRSLHLAMQVVAQAVSPVARHTAFWCVLLPLGGLASANYAGVQATWCCVSKPVVPTYWSETVKLWDAFFPERVARLLPATTVIDEALAKPAEEVLVGLNHRDLMLIFLETYGAVLYDVPEAVAATSTTRNQLEASILASGRHVVSAFYRSPTIGGASDLAHMSVLSGIDLSDPRRHDVLLTTNRPTLLKVFQHAGYETFGLYHSVAWDWVERVYYGFDVYLSGPDLDYQGPGFGFWKVPDQFAAARVEQLYPRTKKARPRFTLFPTISTHFPFHQVPPYQPDWKRLLSSNPFDATEAARAQAEQVNWANMRPDYFRTINYTHTWFSGYFRLPEPRETIYVMIGDHQPTGSVAGEGASWDVPVFIVSRDTRLLNRFQALGFSEGLLPDRTPLGGLHDLTATLLRGLGAETPEVTLALKNKTQ
ncbi:MAG: sulfatase-like hydrolase/transferase [Burkholderiales bacterium]|nr:sulfatase-like hydrolase/transferase [Burkholderiales bacterium]